MEQIEIAILMLSSLVGLQARLSSMGVLYHSFTTDAYQYPDSAQHVVSPGACVFLRWEVIGADTLKIVSNDGEIYDNLPPRGQILVQPSINIDTYTLMADSQSLDLIKMYRPASTHYPANQGKDIYDPSCDREQP